MVIAIAPIVERPSVIDWRLYSLARTDSQSWKSFERMYHVAITARDMTADTPAHRIFPVVHRDGARIDQRAVPFANVRQDNIQGDCMKIKRRGFSGAENLFRSYDAIRTERRMA